MAININAVNSGVTYNTSTAAAAENSSGSDFSAMLNSAASKSTDLDSIFEEASRKYNVPVKLLKAVAKAESNFKPDATSHCGAMGIMQLMPGTAKSLGVTDAYDPEQNIMGGAKYLRQMLDKFGGDVSLALAGYNAGPGAVTKYGGIPPYNETQNYVKKVTGYLNGEDISVGSVTYRGAQNRAGGVIRDTGIQSEETGASDALVEMFLMKMLDLQMKSSDDEDKSIF